MSGLIKKLALNKLKPTHGSGNDNNGNGEYKDY